MFEWINKSSKKLKLPEFSTTTVELPTDVPTKDMSETESPSKKVYSVDQQIINLSRRLQKLREIQALKGIDLEPHYLIEIEDIEEELEELQKQRKDSVN